LKDEEIYNVFNTKKILNRPPEVSITDKSGLAGIAYWINNELELKEDEKIDKSSHAVLKIKEWVDAQFDGGRVNVVSDEEMWELLKHHLPELYKKKRHHEKKD
jgi:hypothetical protein